MKRTKALSLKKAKEASRKGLIKRTNAVMNSCINTINRYIVCAAENGECKTGVWLRNNSGVLTPSVAAEIVLLFRNSGYTVEIEQTENREDYPEEYYISLNWEDAAC